MNKLIKFIFCAVLALLPQLSFAAPPQTINYQGYLTNPGGTPVNTTVVMTFRLYNTASAGTALYTETQLSVPVSNGSFNAVIGASTPIPLPFDVPYWLTVAVNSDAEMSPRQPLASSAYAFRSAAADTVSSTATLAGSQLTGSITSATIPLANVVGASSLGTVTNIATGAGLAGGPITSSGTVNLAATNLLPTTACVANQIPKWNGSGWACATDDGLPSGGMTGRLLAGTLGAPVWTDSPSLGGNLTLVSLSSVTTGNIMKGGDPFIHNTGTGNTFVGVNAGNFTISGINNSAVGENALKNNLTGNGNTANGVNALQNNMTGSGNTANGGSALANNTTGFANTAIGGGALFENLTGSGNTASGSNAMRFSGKSESAGSFVVAAQYTIQSAGTTDFTLIGAANNNAGTVFFASGPGTGTGTASPNTSNNTAFGRDALRSTTGLSNTALGFNAGFNLTTGNNNIVIGHPGAAAESSTIRIGTSAAQIRAFIAGVSGVTTGLAGSAVFVDSAGQLGTISSSRRYKDDIADMDAASSALMTLRPVTFHYKSDPNLSGRTRQYGLIAEEVAQVYPGLVVHSADGQIETVMYQFLPPMLLNEYQKQQRTLAEQAAELAQQREKMRMLARELQDIKAMLGGR